MDTQIQQDPQNDSIDLIALLKKLWAGKKTIIKTTLVFFVIGLFVAVFSKNQYTASTTFVPLVQSDTPGGKLGGLASLAGISLGGGVSNSEISPELYPEIVSSIPYQKELLATPLTIEGFPEKITYASYYLHHYSPGVLGYLKKYTLGLPGQLIAAVKGTPTTISKQATDSKIDQISQEEYDLIQQLQAQLSLTVNAKEGFVTIAVLMDQPLAAAEMAQKAQETLQQYAMDFKTQKSKEELRYIQERHQEKKADFERIQVQLARFQDQNRGINTSLRAVELLRLQSAYDLAFSVYAELSKQLETQNLQVKKDTPLFTVLKPVNIPNEKSQPKRALILVIYVFLGVVLSIGFLLGKDALKELKKQWNTPSTVVQENE